MTALSAPYVLEYGYQRSLGPVTGRFYAGLRDRRIFGARSRSGRVLVPPTEHDPETGDDIDALVEVATSGVVTSWAWEPSPRAGQPLAHAFAWALVRLDGADTALLHAVDAGSPERMRTGMRVAARFVEAPRGSLKDLVFVPEADAPAVAPSSGVAPDAVEPIGVFESPVRLEYTVTAGNAQSHYLRALAEKRILGGRCPSCRKVYVPPRAACPTCAVPTTDEREIAHTGTVTTFCIINIAFEAQAFELPYAAAMILLDGADIPIFHLIQGLPAAEVRMGLRVRARWVPDEKLAPTLRSIDWFEPTGEPDVAYETFSEHL